MEKVGVDRSGTIMERRDTTEIVREEHGCTDSENAMFNDDGGFQVYSQQSRKETIMEMQNCSSDIMDEMFRDDEKHRYSIFMKEVRGTLTVMKKQSTK